MMEDKMNTVSNRRSFIKVGVGTVGALLLSSPISKSFAAVCGLTPPQTEGPFYPGEMQFQKDNDLTIVSGQTLHAKGQVIYIVGKVVDPRCSPIQDANVEIWQACASGKYNHTRDSNPAPLDPYFKYWGETFTNENGEYLFKTVIPGAYPADTDWTRPPHIHFKISRLGYQELVTQMYFKGNPLNSKDLILQQIPTAKRNSVIVDFKAADHEPGSLLGHFDITLKSVR